LKRNFIKNFFAPISIFLLVQSSLSLPVFAEETNTPEELYLLGKVVDSETNKAINNVEISSSIEKLSTDKNGEFLIKIKKDGEITVKSKGYKEKNIKITDIKGKIILEKINFMPIYPSASIGLNYRYISLNETFNKTAVIGSYNDSFSLEGELKLFNSLILGLTYENNSANLERDKAIKSFSSGNLVDLKALYLFKILEDQLEANLGLIGRFEYNGVKQEKNIQIIDYVDYSNQKIGGGLEFGLGFRPVKTFPLSFNTFINYIPLFVSQDAKGTLPSNIDSLGYGLTARYDIKNIFCEAKYLGRSNSKDKYNSNFSGFSIGIGYGF